MANNILIAMNRDLAKREKLFHPGNIVKHRLHGILERGGQISDCSDGYYELTVRVLKYDNDTGTSFTGQVLDDDSGLYYRGEIIDSLNADTKGWELIEKEKLKVKKKPRARAEILELD